MLFGPRTYSAAQTLFNTSRLIVLRRSAMTTSPPSKKARTASPPLHTAPSALAEASTSTQGLDKAALSSRSAHNGAHSNGSSGSRHNLDVAWAKKVKARERDRQASLSKTGEEPIWFDIVQLLGQDKITEVMHNEGKGGGEWADRFQRGTIIEGRVERLTANGKFPTKSAMPCCNWLTEDSWLLSGPNRMGSHRTAQP